MINPVKSFLTHGPLSSYPLTCMLDVNSVKIFTGTENSLVSDMVT